jgi:hypothetical protein
MEFPSKRHFGIIIKVSTKTIGVITYSFAWGVPHIENKMVVAE